MSHQEQSRAVPHSQGDHPAPAQPRGPLPAPAIDEITRVDVSVAEAEISPRAKRSLRHAALAIAVLLTAAFVGVLGESVIGAASQLTQSNTYPSQAATRARGR